MEYEDSKEDMPPVPLTQCPHCREWLEDLDGFGVLRHEACGYCSHAVVGGDACELCGETA